MTKSVHHKGALVAEHLCTLLARAKAREHEQDVLDDMNTENVETQIL